MRSSLRRPRGCGTGATRQGRGGGSGAVRGVPEPLERPVSGQVPDSADPQTTRRWRRQLADERAEARTYRMMAERWEGTDREILLGLAEAEERHIAHWEELLGPDRKSTRLNSSHVSISY